MIFQSQEETLFFSACRADFLRKTSRKRTEILHPNTWKPHRNIYLNTPDRQNPAVIPYTSTLPTLTPFQRPCAENTVWPTRRKPESSSTLHFVRHGLRENPAFLTYRHDTDKKRSHAHPDLSNWQSGTFPFTPSQKDQHPLGFQFFFV